MAIFKCKMCGGSLEINNNETVTVCEYCGTQQTLPKIDDERKANLYDRANHFRRNNEFDKAMGIYEQILTDDNSDAEAYWSLVLCRYGIEYVEDPATHKRIPTVNRAQFTSVFDDDNYKSALQYADSYQRSVYEDEAKAINEIQKGILAISQQEDPFDVFICYKETDNNGRRTPDSVLANELYHQLIQEGFKVFFARITLEDKLGSAYEPYIFAALNSAKVMVVLGTKAEYFNAVWVKNEWSRYLTLIKGGAKKMLIPAYKDMDPYDLPEEFSHLQAQDMSRLGFMQDLIRGIKKIIQIDEPKTAGNKETLATGNNVNIAPLLKRAVMFLEDCDWRSANEYCEKVLDIDPECAEAYLGKLMVDLKVRNKDDLQKQDNLFANNKNYQKALRFADDSLKKSLTDIIQKQIILKEELEIKAEAERLEQERKAEAERLEQERKAEAERLEHERKVEAEKLERKQKTELARKEAERISRRNKKIAVIIISIICLVFVTAAFIIPAGSYKIAINSKNYNEAYEDLYSMLIRPKNGLSELQNELIKNCSVGQIVNFGFTGNGLRSSDIQWLVLEIKDDKALLLLNELLPEYERFLYSDSWETSDIREELNSQFYNTHFTAANKSIIELSTISADNNPDYETAPGNNTQDKVFLLSIEEALRYFPTDKTRKFQNSWWLRTPGSTSGRFSYVNSIGTINTNGTASKLYIRPAIWVNIGD